MQFKVLLVHPRAVSGSALQSQVVLVLALFELQIFQVQRRSFIAFEGGERAFGNVVISIEIKLLDRYLTLSDPVSL